jgi:hypothetical protein
MISIAPVRMGPSAALDGLLAADPLNRDLAVRLSMQGLGTFLVILLATAVLFVAAETTLLAAYRFLNGH